jgi:hypothetical protein
MQLKTSGIPGVSEAATSKAPSIGLWQISSELAFRYFPCGLAGYCVPMFIGFLYFSGLTLHVGLMGSTFQPSGLLWGVHMCRHLDVAMACNISGQT